MNYRTIERKWLKLKLSRRNLKKKLILLGTIDSNTPPVKPSPAVTEIMIRYVNGRPSQKQRPTKANKSIRPTKVSSSLTFINLNRVDETKQPILYLF